MSGLQADNPPVPRANAQVSVIVPKESEYYFTGFCLQVPGKFSDPLGKVPARDKADGAMRLVLILVLEKIPLIFQVVNVNRAHLWYLIIQASADIQSPFFCPGLTRVSPSLFAFALITTWSIVLFVLINICIDQILIKQPSSLGTDNLPCALSDCDETGQPDFIHLKSWSALKCL